MWMIYKKYMKMKGFVLILALLNCAATVTQACGFPPTLENGYITEGEKNEYSKGDVVTYTCHSGYISGRRVKSTCNGDKWETLRATCRKKPCGSPGDTPNGRFHLEGEDFVYTAKVIYTCNEGYQMASLMDYRICLADGWSNDIPHCEVLTCIPEKTDNNIDIISGMFQPGEPIPYANALRFECKSEHLVLRGEPEVYCTANGTWSKPFPKCKEITCEPPSIIHGSVHQQFKKQTYENKDVITFHCDIKYRPAGRSQSTCTKWGWSPEPRCEEITCVIPHNILYGGIDSYKLEFKMNETVTLRCNNGYETVNKKDHEEATCTGTGEWSVPILCKETTCVIPHNIQYGGIDSYKREFKINEAVTLRCNNGYQTENKKDRERATCTETGKWSITLECKEITCVIPYNIQYGGIDSYKREFKINEAVTLRCNNGYQTENKKDRERATCTGTGEWSVPILCKEITCVIPHNIQYGGIDSYKREFKINEAVTLRCNNGYQTENKKDRERATCTETGEWSVPILCKAITCVIPHNILNGGIDSYKRPYKINETVTLRCNNGYQTENKKDRERATCTETGEWSVPILCKEITCVIPYNILYGDIDSYKREYKINEAVTLRCNNGYETVNKKDREKATCTETGEWSVPILCKETTCVIPHNIQYGGIDSYKREYKINEAVTLRCNNGYQTENKKDRERATCTETGKWSIILECKEITCMPPNFIHGSVHQQSKKPIYENKEVITFHCDDKYRPAERSQSTCTKWGWSPEPRCEEITCLVPHNILYGGINSYKREYKINETVTLRCNTGYETVNKKDHEEATCTETGEWSVPILCKEITCVIPYNIQYGGIDSYKREYKINEAVTLRCNNGYETENKKDRERATCTETGKWSITLDCKEITCVIPYNIQYGGIDSYKREYKINEAVTLRCNNGYQTENKKDRERATCTETGKWSITLECKAITCVIHHNILNGGIDSYKREFKMNEAVTLRCNNGYQTENKKDLERATCTETGEWSITLDCKAITCVIHHNILNGGIDSYKLEFKMNEAVTLRCNNGYQTENKKDLERATCTETGKWSITLECKAITCVIHHNILNGGIDSYKREFKMNEAVTLRCNNGYQTENKKDLERATCTETGEWSITLDCKAITCVIHHNILNGGIDSYKLEFKMNEAVTLRCNNGYQTENKKDLERATCTETGKWSITLECKAITCVIHHNILNGGIDSYKREFKMNEAVTLRCNNGYQTENKKDLERATCTETGEWSITLDCKAITCVIHHNILNGGIDSYKLEFKMNEAVTLRCNNGYQTENKKDLERATCTETGKWSITLECKAITCVIPHNIQYGGIDSYKREYKINEAVTLHCNNGYQTENKKDRERATCTETGEWSVPILCKDKGSCLPPPNIENASKKTKEKEVYNNNDIVEYGCHAAYKPENGSSAICVNGTWELPKCILNKTACGTPPYVQYAVITNEEEKYYEKDTVTYICTNNTRLEGSKEITCQNGSWAQPPKCLKVAIFRRCEPLKIDNGYRIPEKSTYDPNESVELGCFPPFELKGQRKITCENGHWTETPQCQRNDGTCEPPPTVEDGIIIKRNERSKSVTYECQRYYVLEGDSTIRCHSGKWSDAPTCIAITCVIHHNILNGGIDSYKREFKMNEAVTLHCNNGYQTENKKDRERATCTETGEWSITLECKEEKCQAPIISDGYFYPNEEYYKIGTLLYYACGPEHKPLIGGTWWKVIQCVNGSWSGDAKCIDKGSCLPPPNIENASKKTKEKEVYNNNDIVEYGCHAAYKPENGSSAICVNGTWKLPKCILAIFRRCEPLKIHHGYSLPEKSTYDPNETVELGCYPPYELKGQRKITCENGHWTETPQCQRNDGACGPPPTVEDGVIIEGNEGSKLVTYECQRYYVLEGDSTVRCQSGKWSDAPTCIGPCIINKEQLKEKKLQDPQTIYLEHGKSHTFVCISRYRVKDTWYKTQVVTCENGQLDVPECV
ncbi:complement factor H isoform X3 [Acipenser ruthenus]|uniref:complement factor H isoform X3 n=1 Tax=Acipenser ruthenus TaxID=7906 RepID=UPI00274208E7|nr:complement factor H isoform X3 [Acipenser ruthenus]